MFDNLESYKIMFSLIDLTTLNSQDTNAKVQELVDYVNKHKEKYSDIPNVAAICVYPPFVEYLKKNIKAQEVEIASVAADFPSS